MANNITTLLKKSIGHTNEFLNVIRVVCLCDECPASWHCRKYKKDDGRFISEIECATEFTDWALMEEE